MMRNQIPQHRCIANVLLSLLAICTTSIAYGDDVEVTGFILVNSQTNVEISSLENGDTIDLSDAGDWLSIVANTIGNVKKVRLELDDTMQRVEWKAPYSLGGDIQGNYMAVEELTWVGSHTIKATPFNDAGEEQATVEVTFTIVDSTVSTETDAPLPVQIACAETFIADHISLGLEIDCHNNTSDLTDQEVEVLEMEFTKAYNELNQPDDISCDPFFREITSMSQETTRRERKNLRHRQLGRSVYYYTNYNCNQCESGSGLFDGAIRRRHLIGDGDSSSSLSSLEKRDRVNKKLFERGLSSEDCLCSYHSVLRVPTKSEVITRINEELSLSPLECQVVSIEGGEGTLSSG